jgi:phosphoadenosine phosphosulfate reductase
MDILMVKKILADGSPCGKCVQAEDILRKRGYWNSIGRVAFAEEGNPDSEGMKIADEHGIELAPFFIVTDGGDRRVYTRVFEFIKKELDGRNAAHDAPSSSENEIFDIASAEKRYAAMAPKAILADAQEAFGTDLVIAFSGAEDVVLIDMASKNGLPFSVFCLDTGRLHEETYAFIDEVRKHYGIAVEVFSPRASLLEPFVKEKGLTSFYEDGHGECCGIRKVEPLGRALGGRRAWATGLRRDQSPATRKDLVHAEPDEAHPGPTGEPLVKINPLLDWTSEKVWDYIRAFDVPYNRLHDEGYKSIGCAPCTRPSRPGEHERMARWWWENETKRECGLHVK